MSSLLHSIWNETAAIFTNSGYALFKIEAHVVCAAVLIILLYRQQNSSDQTEARLAWSSLLSVQILYCIAGIIRVLVDINIIPKNYASRYAAAAITFGLFGAMCWLVFMYMELFQQPESMKSRSKRVIVALPFVFNTFMLVVAGFFPGLFADFSGRTYTRGVLYPVMMLINFAYPAAAVFLSLRRRSRMTRYERDTVPVMATYPAFFMVCGPLQDLNWRIPFLCYIIVISDIFVYIAYADSLISVDPLTKIPNRNSLIENLSERLRKPEPELIHVFAADVEDLSSVNSYHGRQEGDRVLMIVAEALKKFSENEYTCFVSRYYGDEFMIAADIHDDEELELFTERMRNYISNAAMSHNLKYRLRINIGWVKYEHYSRTETISGLVEGADKAMNENKEQRKFQTLWQNVKA